jgi:hypothetical protein
MKTAVCEEVFYAGSAYVWCKGLSSKLSRHPIFVSSPVRFTSGPNGRSTMLTCHHARIVKKVVRRAELLKGHRVTVMVSGFRRALD